MKKIPQKLILLLSLVFVTSFTLPLFSPATSFAQTSPDSVLLAKEDDLPDGDKDSTLTCDPTTDPSCKPGATSTPRGECPVFIGLISWDCNVQLDTISDTDGLSSSIWTIVSNISVDLIVVASYLVIGYVIYGGYLYIFAAGDPSKAATGKKSLYQAFVGLAITLSSYIILNAIRMGLGAANFNHCIESSGTGFTTECYQLDTAGDILIQAIQWVIGIAGVVALIYVVYGAISYITSAGDAGKVQKAKTLIMYSLIGLVIVAIAEIATSFIGSRIREATQTTTITTSAIILIEENSHEIQQIS